jgi:hypothetical protein
MITPVFGVIQTSTKELSMNKLFTTILLSAFASASFASTPNLAPAASDKTAPKVATKAEVKAEAKIAPAKEKAAVKKEETKK